MSLMAANEESDPSAILNGFWVTLEFFTAYWRGERVTAFVGRRQRIAGFTYLSMNFFYVL